MDKTIEETITELFRDFEQAEKLMQAPKNLVINGIKFKLEKEGKTDYDYDQDSESGDYHVYKVSLGLQECFVKINVWYTSYGGMKVKSYAFVKPVEKLVKVFE